MEATVYSQKGKEVTKVKLPETVFGLSWNGDLVSQVVNSMESNSRDPIADTKGRGVVSGGGKKPWQQKGTGRARHGSSRSPIWVKGGVAHGPKKEKNFDRKINRKMKAKALYTVLSKKLLSNEIIFVDSLSFDAPKTKSAKEIIGALGGAHKDFKTFSTKKNNAGLIAISEKNVNVEKSFANFGNMDVQELRNLNVVDVLNSKFLVIENPEKAIKFFASKKLLAKTAKK